MKTNRLQQIKTTAQILADYLKNDAESAPTPEDALFRLEAIDLAVNFDGDGRYDLSDLIAEHQAAAWLEGINIDGIAPAFITEMQKRVCVTHRPYRACQLVHSPRSPHIPVRSRR